MEFGFEAAGGIIEKFLPGVSFPVLMNTILPGLLCGAALYPFTTGRLRNFLSLDVERSWPQLAIAGVLLVTLGALISALTSQFYKMYDGQIGWHPLLLKWATGLQRWRVDRNYKHAEEVKNKNSFLYDIYWSRLRDYPIDPKTALPCATRPTLLGNIVNGYEQYPKDRYGIDAGFYWPRLWLLVDKDQKHEISQSWAVADGLVNLSAVSFLAGMLWLSASSGVALGFLGPRWLPVGQKAYWTVLAVVGWFGLGYGLYRLSLPFHRKNGENFKSLFDLYRDKLWKLTSLSPSERELWEAAWAYLQYLQIRCPKCKKTTLSAVTGDCKNNNCLAHEPEFVASLFRVGKFVNDPCPPQESPPERSGPHKI